jgi:hypothetical protein
MGKYCTWRSIHSPAGYPDLCLAKPGRLIYAELKSEKGKVSDKQREWLDTLKAAGAEAYVWRPSQFEEAVEILRGKKEANGNLICDGCKREVDVLHFTQQAEAELAKEEANHANQ